MIIRMKSSSGDYHIIDINYYEDNLNIHCSCTGAKFGNICKHQKAVIYNKADMLYDNNDNQKLQELIPIFEKFKIKEKLNLFDIELKKIDKEQKKVIALFNDVKKKLKKDFQQDFLNGIYVETPVKQFKMSEKCICCNHQKENL